MSVGFKKVQSDDPQPPDSLCNTFTKAREEGESQLPLYSPLIIPHYLHTALEAGRSSPEWKGCSLLPLAAGLKLAKFVAFTPDFRQQVLECSSFLLD